MFLRIEQLSKFFRGKLRFESSFVNHPDKFKSSAHLLERRVWVVDVVGPRVVLKVARFTSRL
jgi:hypothetical protein